MGAMKDFAMDVSYVMGQDGEITDEVCCVAGMITAKKLEEVGKPWSSQNPLFVQLVKDSYERYKREPYP